MAKSLTKSQITAKLAEAVGKQGYSEVVSKKLVDTFLTCLAELAYKEAKNKFTLPGIGKLVVSHRKKRMGRNPATGETMEIPAKRVVKFRVAKVAKESILGTK